LAGTSGGQNPNPNVAGPGGGGGGSFALENFSDVAKRLKYLFPALLLGVVGFLAGRIGRPPARLPR
jgi:hypothetical protein